MGFFWVALGGAIGAMARYAVSLIPVKSTFPWLTLFTNLVGAMLIGFITGIAAEKKWCFAKYDFVLENWCLRRVYYIFYFFIGNIYPAGT